MSEQAQIAAVSAKQINSRIDRLPFWGAGPVATCVLALCFLLCFYDIEVMGVTLPSVASDLQLNSFGKSLPVTANLVGNVIGALLLGTVADRFGRRRTLFAVLIILGAGAILTGLSWDAWSLGLFRFITGLGIGSQITLTSTLIGEFSPAAGRGRYIARSVLLGAVGNIVPAALSVPLLSWSSTLGWRILFAAAGVVLLCLPLLNDRLVPESPRWLAVRGDLARADAITTRMEERVARRTGSPLPPTVDRGDVETKLSARVLLSKAYRLRLLAVFGFWFMFYFAEYAFLSYETTFIKALGVALPNALLITLVGFFGGVVGALVVPVFIDRFERKYCVCGGLAVFVVAFLLFAFVSNPIAITVACFLGSAAIFLTIIPGYAYTSEVFPTGARASAMGITEGVGHLGGAVQPFIVIAVLDSAGASTALSVLAGVMVLGLLIMTTGVRTTGRSLSEAALQ